MRHVRDIWKSAQNGGNGFKNTGQQIGNLLVTRRSYTTNGVITNYPGHIGIITELTGEQITWIHASPPAGLVEERSLRTLSTILGSITVTKT